jgi:septal ring factor EnvC (AmiA/AmiB activator)
MKKYVIFLAWVFLLPMHPAGQGTDYLTTKNFQAEKKRLQESLARVRKSTQDLQKQLTLQRHLLDSLNRLLTDHESRITLQQDSLFRLKTIQADLDNRLSTQKKSGTLMAVLIPVILFILILALWFLWFDSHRKFRAAIAGHSGEIGELRMKHEDHHAANLLDKAEMLEKVNTALRNLESRIDTAFREVSLRCEKMELLHQEEKSSHDARHQEAQREMQAFREESMSSYKSVTDLILKIKQETENSMHDLLRKLNEIREEKTRK